MKKKAGCFCALALACTLPFSNESTAAFPKKQHSVHVTNFTATFNHKPEGGFKTLTHPITVLSGPSDTRFYYARYVWFDKPDSAHHYNAFYYGIQPRGQGNAAVIFSFFGKHARVVDTTHCRSGADGGNGVSCSATIPFHLGTEYFFNIKLVEENATENIWKGTVQYSVGPVVTRDIGTWATPKTSGYLSDKGMGFVEHYPGIDRCADIPATRVRFGGRAFTQYGAGAETLHAPYAVGVCKGKVAFSSTLDPKSGDLTITQQQGVD